MKSIDAVSLAFTQHRRMLAFTVVVAVVVFGFGLLGVRTGRTAKPSDLLSALQYADMLIAAPVLLHGFFWKFVKKNGSSLEIVTGPYSMRLPYLLALPLWVVLTTISSLVVHSIYQLAWGSQLSGHVILWLSTGMGFTCCAGLVLWYARCYGEAKRWIEANTDSNSHTDRCKFTA